MPGHCVGGGQQLGSRPWSRKAVVTKQGKMYRLDRHPMEMLLASMRECHSKQEGHSEPDQRGGSFAPVRPG